MPSLSDTIAALATPTGTSAIAVLRVSGPDTKSLAREIFGKAPAVRLVSRADYVDRSGNLVDDVLATFFQGPRSYTGEDALEISCHGNPFIAQKILEDLFARGCRPADAGEFTQRAFLNGRMDLSQAEAVMDLIHARSERALAAAHQLLRGELGRRMNALVERLLGVLARIEAHIDFPEEDLPPEDRAQVESGISSILFDIKNLESTSQYGRILREGLHVVILGRPNVGKSSLLNALVGRDRALVSPEPGTTRDFIEDHIVVGPHFIRLVDTAGLNPSPGGLERLGMEKALERLADADLVLLVTDSSEPTRPALPAETMTLLDATSTIIVQNKMDLGIPSPSSPLPGATLIETSALTGTGIEDLRAAIIAKADAFRHEPNNIVGINARHAHRIANARGLLQSGLTKLRSAAPTELVASDLRDALAAFGEIIGRIDNERMLDQLFATFCIGK